MLAHPELYQHYLSQAFWMLVALSESGVLDAGTLNQGSWMLALSIRGLDDTCNTLNQGPWMLALSIRGLDASTLNQGPGC